MKIIKTLQTASQLESKRKEIDLNVLLDRLEERRNGRYNFPDSSVIECVFGIDPLREISASGWTCMLPRQKLPPNLALITFGTEVVGEIVQMMPINDVEAVRAGGERYLIGKDAWGNPSVYLQNNKNNYENRKPFRTALEKASQIWEAAVSSEEQLRKVIGTMLGNELLTTVVMLLFEIEKYPEMLTNSYWIKDLDLWDIAYRGGTVEGATKFLRGEGYGVKLPYGMDKTPMYQRCLVVIGKIIKSQLLDPEERAFINAITVSRFATRKSIRSVYTYGINDFTRRYAIANLVENMLCRELVGWGVYEQHLDDYEKFIETLEKSGYVVPDWFKPYDGNEFVWGFALDETIANGGNNYFLSSGFNQEDITHNFNHERIHRLVMMVKERGRSSNFKNNASDLSVERYEESYTEALALLIQHRGNVGAAIVHNNRQTIRYKNGVSQLLMILDRINKEGGDELLGAKLMIDGLKAIVEGKTLQQSSVVQSYYDLQICHSDGAFDISMSPYDDRNGIRVKWGVDNRVDQAAVSNLAHMIDQIGSNMQFESLPLKERQMYGNRPDGFEKSRELELNRLRNDPALLLRANPPPLTTRILKAVSENEVTRKELQALINLEYEQYSLALKRLLKAENEEPLL